MNSETKVISIIGLITLVIIVAGVFLASGSKPALPEIRVKEDSLVREKSLRIKAENPKIQLVEFADFQCPACALFHPTLKQIKSEYKDKIDFVFRVLPIHEHSVLTASAVFAAREQGKMIEMHDIIFEKQEEWAAYGTKQKEVRAFLDKYAAQIGLDMQKFNQDMISKAEEYKSIIDQDALDASIMGIQSTPTLLINGKPLIRGVVSYPQLKSIIDTELSASSTRSSAEGIQSTSTLPITVTGSVVNGSPTR
jgi:protein-disulfide isomerase